LNSTVPCFAELEKVIRRGEFQITVNRAFREVMMGCAAPGPGRRDTGLPRKFLKAYTSLHEQGNAHSLECWLDDRFGGRDLRE